MAKQTTKLATETMDKGRSQYEIKLLYKDSFEIECCYYPYVEFSNASQWFYNAYITQSGKNGIITGQFIRDAVHYRDLGKKYVAVGFVRRILDKIQEVQKIEDQDDRDLQIKEIAEEVKDVFDEEVEA
jgi:nucleoside-diphosphate-sugar epimerase